MYSPCLPPQLTNLLEYAYQGRIQDFQKVGGCFIVIGWPISVASGGSGKNGCLPSRLKRGKLQTKLLCKALKPLFLSLEGRQMALERRYSKFIDDIALVKGRMKVANINEIFGPTAQSV